MNAPLQSPPLPPALRPSRKFRNTLLGLLGVIVFLIAAFAWLKINPLRLFTEFHYVWSLMQDMLPPNYPLLWKSWSLWGSILETVSMAILGTLIGGALAFVLAFFAAANTTPNRSLRMLARVGLAVQRVAPDYAIMMIILIVVGFGPFAGTLALIVGSAGTFGKFFADAIENLDEASLDGVRVLGGSRTQVFRYAVVPQALPSFIANGFFLLEINMSGAIALGAFGGGGLGFHLNVAYDTLNYRDMLAYITVIVVMMVGIERLSDYWRRRIFSGADDIT